MIDFKPTGGTGEWIRRQLLQQREARGQHGPLFRLPTPSQPRDTNHTRDMA